MKSALLATALAAAVATTPAPPAASVDSATDRELARLTRLSADDAARQSRETTIRNAPGHESVEIGEH